MFKIIQIRLCVHIILMCSQEYAFNLLKEIKQPYCHHYQFMTRIYTLFLKQIEIIEIFCFVIGLMLLFYHEVLTLH